MSVDAADKKFAKQGILNALGEDALEYAKKQILVERIEHLSECWRNVFNGENLREDEISVLLCEPETFNFLNHAYET